VPRVGDLAAQSAQRLEEHFVAGDFAGAFRAAHGGRFIANRLAFRWTRERNLAAFLQRAQTFIGQLDRWELTVALTQETEPDQFATNGLPLEAREFAADAVGAKLWVVPFANAFGIGTRENLDLVN